MRCRCRVPEPTPQILTHIHLTSCPITLSNGSAPLVVAALHSSSGPLCREHAQVSKSVTAAEAAAQAEAEAKKRNKAGLDSVLASLQAAKKVNVLDKSRSDWKDFKTSDTKVPSA